MLPCRFYSTSWWCWWKVCQRCCWTWASMHRTSWANRRVYQKLHCDFHPFSRYPGRCRHCQNVAVWFVRCRVLLWTALASFHDGSLVLVDSHSEAGQAEVGMSFCVVQIISRKLWVQCWIPLTPVYDKLGHTLRRCKPRQGFCSGEVW